MTFSIKQEKKQKQKELRILIHLGREWSFRYVKVVLERRFLKCRAWFLDRLAQSLLLDFFENVI